MNDDELINNIVHIANSVSIPSESNRLAELKEEALRRMGETRELREVLEPFAKRAKETNITYGTVDIDVRLLFKALAALEGKS